MMGDVREFFSGEGMEVGVEMVALEWGECLEWGLYAGISLKFFFGGGGRKR